MTTAKELRDAATPLPWDNDSGDWERDLDATNANLIVYAVNRLPDYEAAVEALDVMLNSTRADELHPAWEKARAALARLREEVPELDALASIDPDKVEPAWWPQFGADS